MDGKISNTPGIKDVFAIIELLKKYKVYEHETDESSRNVSDLQEEATTIIEALKANQNLSELESEQSIEDYSKKWNFKTSEMFPFLKQLKGKGRKKSILQHAVENYSETDKTVKENLKSVIKCLIENCPGLILLSNQGVAPLLSVILMQSDNLVESMLGKLTRELKENEKKETGNVTKGIDKKIREVDFKKVGGGRILSACSVYHVAALMLKPSLFDIFIEYCGTLCFESGDDGCFGDNVLHALVRYGSRDKSKINDIISMLKYLNTLKDSKLRKRVHDLWMQTNEDGLTPLQLAAEKGQHQIFEFIMSLEMLYYFRDGDEDCYDVTEIDTVPSEDNKKKDQDSNEDEDNKKKDQDSNEDEDNKKKDQDSNEDEKKKGAHKSKSVLHLIRYLPDKYSIPIANMPAVKAVIDTKWMHYRKFIWSWFLIHLVLMGLCAWYAVIRAQLTYPFFKHDQACGLGICMLVYGIICLIMQVMRNVNKFRRNRYKKILVKYANIKCSGCKISSIKFLSMTFMFPWCFALFGLLVLLDFALACSDASYSNCLLPYVLILGWGLSLYFLQVFHYFSIFVVLIRRISSIIFQFAIISSFYMVGFSAAAYLELYTAELENDKDTFKHFGKTVFKMFTIMIAIADLNEVFDAENLILTIPIFVLFSLLTAILLLNALIAYLTEICSLMAEYSKRGTISSKVFARLQRLTVIVQLEDFLPICFLKKMGEIETITSIPDEKRKYISLRSPVETKVDSPLETYEESEKHIKNPSFGESRDPIINNKVFPDKKQTLEITEITQAYCKDDSCDNKNYFSVRSVK